MFWGAGNIYMDMHGWTGIETNKWLNHERLEMHERFFGGNIYMDERRIFTWMHKIYRMHWE